MCVACPSPPWRAALFLGISGLWVRDGPTMATDRRWERHAPRCATEPGLAAYDGAHC